MINKYQQFSAITVQYQQTSQVIGKNGIFSTDCLNCMNNKGLHVKFVVLVVYAQYLVTDSKVSFCVRTLMMA